MPGCGAQLPAGSGAEGGVDLFERPKKAGEMILERYRALPGLAEIAMAELVGSRNDCRAQRAVLMSALRPCEVSLKIEPDGEAHSESLAGCGSVSGELISATLAAQCLKERRGRRLHITCYETTLAVCYLPP